MKIGILGAAAIAPTAIITPSSSVAGVEAYAVAARDAMKAEKFAKKHGLSKSYGNYEALLADEEIDAIYIPLPNGLHGEWTIKALQAGKHVLCEKPFTANAQEAEAVAEVTRQSGLTVMEAFHWRYHALASRVQQIIQSGEIGHVQHVEMSMCFPLPVFSNIRWQWSLAGGSLMDAGCYCVSIVRFLANAEADCGIAVTRANAKTLSDNRIDRWTTADLAFGNGVTGTVTAAMWSGTLLKMKAKVTGSQGELHILNPILPQLFNRLTVISGDTRRSAKVAGEATYPAQLRAFKAACEGEATNITGVDYAVRNMDVIDAIYKKAGLPVRQPRADIE
ncbi:MAG: Gfo/Idh/MocA family oxidoreductase [Halioglobus sp.]